MLLWWSFGQWLADTFTAPVATPGSLCDSETVLFENRIFIVPFETRSYLITESRTFMVKSEDRAFTVHCGDC